MSKDFPPQNIKNAIERAFEISKENNNQFVLPEAFFLGLIEKEPSCKSYFDKFCKKKQIDTKDLIEKIKKYISRENIGFSANPDLSVSCIRVMQTANAIAAENGTNIVENPEYFFCAIMMEDKTFISNCLKAIGMTMDGIKSSTKRKKKTSSKIDDNIVFDEVQMDEDWMSDFCQDLVAVAKEGKIDEIVGRKDEIERLITVDTFGHTQKRRATSRDSARWLCFADIVGGKHLTALSLELSEFGPGVLTHPF